MAISALVHCWKEKRNNIKKIKHWRTRHTEQNKYHKFYMNKHALRCD